MGAPKGNDYYRLRAKDGRDKMFQTPGELQEACNNYFQWCEENPLLEEVAFHSQGIVKTTSLKKVRAYTLQGLCNFLDISTKGFKLYEKRKDFVHVTTRVREIMYTQKFEGAAAGLLNPNIIARDLGIKEHIDHTTQGDKIGLSRELRDLVGRSSSDTNRGSEK